MAGREVSGRWLLCFACDLCAGRGVFFLDVEKFIFFVEAGGGDALSGGKGGYITSMVAGEAAFWRP